MVCASEPCCAASASSVTRKIERWAGVRAIVRRRCLYADADHRLAPLVARAATGLCGRRRAVATALRLCVLFARPAKARQAFMVQVWIAVASRSYAAPADAVPGMRNGETYIGTHK